MFLELLLLPIILFGSTVLDIWSSDDDEDGSVDAENPPDKDGHEHQSDTPPAEDASGHADRIEDTTASPGDDFLVGTPGADSLYADQGADHILGNGGADILRGGPGEDIIDARDTGPGAADIVFGGSEDDILITDAGDVATGGPGDDLFAITVRPGDPPVEITDFSPGDQIEVLATEAEDADRLETTINPDEDRVELSLGGTVIATFPPTTNLPEDSLRLTTGEDAEAALARLTR